MKTKDWQGFPCFKFDIYNAQNSAAAHREVIKELKDAGLTQEFLNQFLDHINIVRVWTEEEVESEGGWDEGSGEYNKETL